MSSSKEEFLLAVEKFDLVIAKLEESVALLNDKIKGENKDARLHRAISE